MQANLICVGSKPDASFDLIFLSRDRKAHFGQFPRLESKRSPPLLDSTDSMLWPSAFLGFRFSLSVLFVILRFYF